MIISTLFLSPFPLLPYDRQAAAKNKSQTKALSYFSIFRVSNSEKRQKRLFFYKSKVLPEFWYHLFPGITRSEKRFAQQSELFYRSKDSCIRWDSGVILRWSKHAFPFLPSLLSLVSCLKFWVSQYFPSLPTSFLPLTDLPSHGNSRDLISSACQS